MSIKKGENILSGEEIVDEIALFSAAKEREDENARWSFVFTLITVLGCAGVGAALMLSEILYADIEELSLCPSWYRVFLLLSIGLSLIGAIGCAICKRPKSGALYVKYKKEQNFYFAVFALGFLIMIISAFIEKETYFLDCAICFGGALCYFGLIAFLGCIIGFSFAERKTKFLKLLYALHTRYPEIILRPAARGESVFELRRVAESPLPLELIELYMQTDGDTELLFCADKAAFFTRRLREDFSDFNPEIANIICFAGDEDDNFFCYKTNDLRSGIFYLNFETLELTCVAHDMCQLISLYYGRYLN